jgi:hypothetical protein
MLHKAGFNRRGKRNWVRTPQDIVQLVNLQKSEFSEEEYLNVALWPTALGSAGLHPEYKYPIRARIQDLLGEEAAVDADHINRLIDDLDHRLASFDRLISAYEEGKLDTIYITAEARSLMSEPSR